MQNITNNMQNMTKNMQCKMQSLQILKNMQARLEYAEYWQVYILHILHIFTLPTLLMSLHPRPPAATARWTGLAAVRIMIWIGPQ